MDQPGLSSNEAGSMSLPRRILRKGTHSCAECKRRKTRCFFESPTATTCVGCQRRGTACIGQEFVDVPVSRRDEDPPTRERLERIESMLQRLTDRVFSSDGSSILSDAPPPQPSLGRPSTENPDTDPDLVSEGGYLHSQAESSKKGKTPSHISPEGTAPRAQGPSYQPEANPGPIQYAPSHLFSMCRTLHTAFPSQEDVNILFEAGRATIYLQALCNSYRELFEQGNSLSSNVLSAIPPETAHPVLLARKLLHLSLCMQQLDPSFDRSSLRLQQGLEEAMQGYFHLATSMVTCHDELLNSLEGLECLICEAVYLVNCGNLRRALVCLRRASTLAQFMGMHRKGSRTSLKRPGDTGLGGRDLGASGFGSHEKTSGETDAEWFERTQVDICELIINRGQHSGEDSFNMTMEIDATLTRVSNSVSSTWWTPMDLDPQMSIDEVMARVISAQMQIVHYNMLNIVHLPYLLRQDAGSRYDYSKTVCTYSSREVLNRYITFRSVVRVVYCCRLVDFCALTAALTLLIAHLSGHGRNSSWLPAHQRVGDRNLAEKVVETLEELNRLNHDELSKETAKLTRKLLDLEAAAARNGSIYRCSVRDENCNPDGMDGPFHLKIPYFGTVWLEPNSSTSTDSVLLPTLPDLSNVLGHASEPAATSSNTLDLPRRPGEREEELFPSYNPSMVQESAGMDFWTLRCRIS
uniref:Zn(2)-C6 fungal-type domain-containing protein n=1 Tax=Bionectria ochroleuca TaxID=29856 RepID=A0A8H7K8N4_BIOOC